MEEVQQFYNYPVGRLRIDATTRIAFSLVLIKTTLFHHAALAKLCDKLGTVFKSKWDELKEEDWRYLQEVEGICYELHSYAMMEAQVDCTTASRKIFLPFICKEFVSSTEFRVLQINGNTSRVDKVDGMKRVSRLKTDFTENGKKCLKRLEEQVKLRFGNFSTDDCAPIFFDPITKNFAKTIIGENLYDSVDIHLCRSQCM